WLPAELCVQNLHPGGLVRKIDTNSYVKPSFPDQRVIQTIQSVRRGHQHKSTDRVVMVNRAHQRHGDVVELTPRTACVADRILTASSKRVDFIDEEKDRLAACCLSEHSLDVFSSRANPAVQQFRSGYVFEVQPELASGRSRQKRLPGSTWTVQKDPVSNQPIAFVFSRIQMSLNYLADLFLCLFHAADICVSIRWHIANHLDRPQCWPLYRRANCDGDCSG